MIDDQIDTAELINPSETQSTKRAETLTPKELMVGIKNLTTPTLSGSSQMRWVACCGSGGSCDVRWISGCKDEGV